MVTLPFSTSALVTVLVVSVGAGILKLNVSIGLMLKFRFRRGIGIYSGWEEIVEGSLVDVVVEPPAIVSDETDVSIDSDLSRKLQ